MKTLKLMLHCDCVMCFAELSIDNRVDSATTTDIERRPCVDGVVSVSAEDKNVEVPYRSSNIDLDSSSRCEVESPHHNPDSQPVSRALTCAPLSPGSSSMRHSASDSLVYRGDVELASSCEVLTDCLQTEAVAGSVGLNGYCKAVEETCASQVGLVEEDSD